MAQSQRDRTLNENCIKLYNFVLDKQEELQRSITIKEICKGLDISDRDVRHHVNALRLFHRGRTDGRRIIPHFIGETGEGFKIGSTPMEDEDLRMLTGNIALKKANNLEAKGLNIIDNESWGDYDE